MNLIEKSKALLIQYKVDVNWLYAGLCFLAVVVLTIILW